MSTYTLSRYELTELLRQAIEIYQDKQCDLPGDRAAEIAVDDALYGLDRTIRNTALRAAQHSTEVKDFGP